MTLQNNTDLKQIVEANSRNITNDSSREFVDKKIHKAAQKGHEVEVFENHLTDNVVKSLRKDKFLVNRCYDSESNHYYTKVFWGSEAQTSGLITLVFQGLGVFIAISLIYLFFKWIC